MIVLPLAALDSLIKTVLVVIAQTITLVKTVTSSVLQLVTAMGMVSVITTETVCVPTPIGEPLVLTHAIVSTELSVTLLMVLVNVRLAFMEPFVTKSVQPTAVRLDVNLMELASCVKMDTGETHATASVPVVSSLLALIVDSV